MTFTGFTVSAGSCSGVTYTLTKSDATAIDTTVFTFTASTPKLVIYSTDTAKIATYSFILTGKLTSDSTISTTTSFSVVINS